jgi:hypothetical protein
MKHCGTFIILNGKFVIDNEVYVTSLYTITISFQ